MQNVQRAEKSSPRNKITENQSFRCYYLRNQPATGLVRLRIAKKIIRNAVDRNKIKRWIREISLTMEIENKQVVCVSLLRKPPDDFEEFKNQLKEAMSAIR